MKIKIKYQLWCFFLFTSIVAAAQRSINIDSCEAMAKRNFPLIKQYDLIEQSKEYTVSNANKAYLPQISINGIGAYVFSSLPSDQVNNPQFIGIGQLNQVLWDGGATHAQKEIATASAEVDKATLDVSLYEIRERVDQLYFGILVIDEQLKQLDIINDNLTRSLNKVKLAKDNGLSMQPDVDEVKAEVLNSEQKRIEFNFTRKGYIEMLALMTGMPLEETVQLEKPVAAENYATLTNNRPELNLYARQLKLNEARLSIDKVNNMPKIGLLGAGVLLEPGISLGPTEFSSLAVAGLSVSWNTGGLYRTSNNKQLTKIQMDRINNQQEAFLFNNNLQLKQASTEIEKQKAIVSKDDEIILLKGTIKNAYQLKYDNGMCSMYELINAINKESEAQSNRALHNVQLLMSMYNYKTKNGN